MLDALVTHGYLRSQDRDALVGVSTPADLLVALRTWAAPAPKWTDSEQDSALETVAWVHVQAGRLLTVRAHGKEVCYLPGGKIEPGETPATALRRELREELGVDLGPVSIAPQVVIDAPAEGHDRRRLRMHCYTGQATGRPTANREVESLHWLGNPSDPSCAPAVTRLLRYLRPGLDPTRSVTHQRP